jgi:hypothetical protein
VNWSRPGHAAQQAVEAAGRTSSPTAGLYLSPVVDYHGLGQRILILPRFPDAAAA